VAACAGGLLDRFRSAGCVGAARFETNDRLSFDNHLGYCMLGLFALAASPTVAATIDTQRR
jgi:hypothetical protein